MKLRNLWFLLALALAPACKSGKDHDTAIIVYVQSDLAVPSEIDRVKITTTSVTTQALLHEYTFMLGPGEQRVPLPIREGLYPTNDSQAAIRVEAQGLLGQGLVVARSAVLSFVPGEPVLLDLSLLASCRLLTCPTGKTCGPHGCQPETVDGKALPIYKPGLTPTSSPKVDASAADVSSDGALDTGGDRPGDASKDVPVTGADASPDSALDRPESTGTETSTASGTGSGMTETETGTGPGQTQTNTSAGTGTSTAATGTGSSVVTGTGSGTTASNTGMATATVTNSDATATVTAATATQTSLSTAPTATGTGTTTGTGTATKTGTMTTIGTTIITGLVTGTASATATLNITVPSATTAIITQTITDTATAIGTASVTYSVTATSTAASTNTATSSAGAMAMTYLQLTKYDSLPAATDTSTSTLTAGGTASDLSGRYFCGTGIYEKTMACNAYVDNVAAGQASPFASSSTRYQIASNSSSRIYDCAWYPTPAGKLSISVWVKPSQLAGGKQSILAWNFGDVQLFIDSNNNAACLPLGTTPTNVMPLPPNQWTHLVCTQNATSWTLYMNGSATKVTNTGPSTFRNPQPSPSVVNCLGYWYVSGWDLTNTSNPCVSGSQTPARFAGDLSTLRIYHDYTLSPLEVDNLRLCNNTACTGTVLVTGTATASTTATVPITITVTATSTAVGTVPTTTTETATGTVSTLVTSIGSSTATFVQTGTQTQVAHRMFGW
jgi:hypothetical protein